MNSILKIKDPQTENWIQIPTIKGDKGDKGDKGPKGDRGESLFVARTSSDMINSSYIYLYVGSQAGYTFGDWYYYDGSNWVSGGTYGTGAEDAAESALVSEGYAVGKQNGIDVLSDIPYYHNNAKYYKEQAVAAKTAAEAAQAAAEAAAEQAEGVIEIDDTLSVEGRAADAKVTGDKITGLKEDLSVYTGNERIKYITGGYITTNVATVDVTDISSDFNYAYAVVDCAQNDVFTVNGVGGASARVWCFIDTNGNSLRVAPNGITSDNQVIIAPENASKLILNDKSGTNSSYKGRILADAVDNNDKTTEVIGNIISIIDDGKMVFDYSLFEYGTYYTSSQPVYFHMIRSINTITLDRQVTVTAKSGFKLKQLDATRTHDTGWVDSATFEANTPYYISIRRETIDATETANFAEFVSALTFDSSYTTDINSLDNRITQVETATVSNTSRLTTVETKIAKEYIKSNDTYHANGRFIKCYNPYKEQKSLTLCGQLHCHTRDISTGLYYDGTSTAETTLTKYRQLGYDFMTITDYGNTPGGLSKPSSNDIPSGLTWLFDSQEVRIDTLAGSDNPAVHICTYNSKSPITGLKGVSVQDYIDEYKTDGLMMSLAHPFSPGLNLTFAQLDEIKTRLRFVECFNGLSAAQDEEGTYPYAIPTGYGTDFAWQRLLDNGNAVWGVAVSDAHTISVDWRMLYGCVYVFANQNSAEEILKNLCCGNFIASEYLGNTVSQPTFVNGVYSIDTGSDSATTVFYKENSQIVKTVTGRVATYTMAGDEKYVRAVVTKGLNNRKIWVQPVINDFSEDYDNYSDFIKP